MLPVQECMHRLRSCMRDESKQHGVRVRSLHAGTTGALFLRSPLMPHCEGHITDVAGLVIESTCLAGSPEHAHAALPLDVILPFVGVGVPMQFTQSARIRAERANGTTAKVMSASVRRPMAP
jgi:hypothetical protein